MLYCISDIHGCYDEFMSLLEEIKFSTSDTLYILGDAIDRGKDSIKCLQHIQKSPNIHMLIGNHEFMMQNALVNKVDFELWHNRNGGNTTLYEFKTLTEQEQQILLNYLSDLPFLLEVTVNDKHFLLTHAGLRMYSNMTKENMHIQDIMAKQDHEDMLWIREEFYGRKGIPNYTIVFGHTPTRHLHRKRSNRGIWHDTIHNDKIDIDCGCVQGGKLAALRLDDLQEFYVKVK